MSLTSEKDGGSKKMASFGRREGTAGKLISMKEK